MTMKLLLVFFISLLGLVAVLDAQTLAGCGTEFGCFPAPTGCVAAGSSDASKCEFVVKFRTDATNGSVAFVLSARVSIASNSSGAYVAVGFAGRPEMTNASVVVCKTGEHAGAESYHTLGHKGVAVVDAADRSLGLSGVSVSVDGELITCSFSRLRYVNDTFKETFFDIGVKDTFHLLAAKGQLRATGEPAKHVAKIPSSVVVDFNSTATVVSAVSHLMAKVHGILMIVAWVLFASVGILLPRYMKFLWPDRKPLGVEVWFFGHRLLMICVPLLSLAGLLIILIHKEWTWVSRLKTKNFAHSITGILAISLSVAQVLGGATRPAKDAPSRPAFNWGHRLSGLTTLLLAIATLCLGFSFFLPGHAWTISLIWAGWILVAPIAFELFDRNSSDEKVVNSELRGNERANRRKTVLFAVHVVVQVAITTALIVRIVIV